MWGFWYAIACTLCIFYFLKSLFLFDPFKKALMGAGGIWGCASDLVNFAQCWKTLLMTPLKVTGGERCHIKADCLLVFFLLKVPG